MVRRGAPAAALLLLGCWLALCRADDSCSSVELSTDRPGSDYQRTLLSAPDYTACLRACCNDTRCGAWTYVQPGVQAPQAVCYLKEGAPAADRNNVTISGRPRASPTLAPTLPPAFTWTAGWMRGGAAPATALVTDFYDYDASKFARVFAFANGTTYTVLQRFDRAQRLDVWQVPGAPAAVCVRSALAGTLFAPSVLAGLSATGPALVLGRPAAGFAGEAPGWFASLPTAVYVRWATRRPRARK